MTTPRAWCPRHTPSIGWARSPQASIIAMLTPASSGVPGPGDTRTPSKSAPSAAETASLRTTSQSAPSCWRYPTMVNTKLS